MVGHLNYEMASSAAVTQYRGAELHVSPLSGFSVHA
jgi:hypothetical protein